MSKAVLGGGGGGGPPNVEPGGTSTAATPHQTDVVDLDVEDSDSISRLEVLGPAHDVAEVFFSTPFDPLCSVGRPPAWTGLLSGGRG